MADVVALEQRQAPAHWDIPDDEKHGPPAPLQWTFCLDRENHGLEVTVQDDAGHVVATWSLRHESTTPGFDLSRAWDELVGKLSPTQH